MARIPRRAFAIGGAIGAVLIAAAQTKPEDAQGNIAGWLRLLGVDRIPEPLSAAGADTWATVAGAAMMLVAAGSWALAKRRRRLAVEAGEAVRRRLQEMPPETPPGRLVIDWEGVHPAADSKGSYKAAHLSPGGMAVMLAVTGEPGGDPRVQYRCEVINHGEVALVRIELLPTVTFANVERTLHELQPSDILYQRDLPISISKLGVGEKFEFYVVNTDDTFAYLEFPAIAAGQRVDCIAPQLLTVAIAPKDPVMRLRPVRDHSATVEGARRAMRDKHS